MNDINIKTVISNIDKYKERNKPNHIISRSLITSMLLDSKSFGKFLPIDYYMVNGVKYFTVVFVDTGSIVSGIANKEIHSGKIRDPLARSMYHIGYLGSNYKDLKNTDLKLFNSLYQRWARMIDRCYNKDNKYYNLYGGSGITIDERWHNFSNFFTDAYTLPGFDRDLIIDGILTIDKDKYQTEFGLKIYSRETCCWLTKKEQSSFVDHDARTEKYKKDVYVVSPNGDRFIIRGIRKCARELNMSYNTIASAFSTKGIAKIHGYTLSYNKI